MINSITQGLSLPRLIESQNAIIVHNIFIVSIDCAMDHHIQQPNNNYFSNAQLLLQYESVCVTYCYVYSNMCYHFSHFHYSSTRSKLLEKMSFPLPQICLSFKKHKLCFKYDDSYQYINLCVFLKKR